MHLAVVALAVIASYFAAPAAAQQPSPTPPTITLPTPAPSAEIPAPPAEAIAVPLLAPNTLKPPPSAQCQLTLQYNVELGTEAVQAPQPNPIFVANVLVNNTRPEVGRSGQCYCWICPLNAHGPASAGALQQVPAHACV